MGRNNGAMERTWCRYAAALGLVLIGGAACGLTTDDDEQKQPRAPTSDQVAAGSGDADYEGAPICSTLVPFGGFYPEGCAPGMPAEGTPCEAEGVACPKDLVAEGEHIRQRIAHCRGGSWRYESEPCSNECTATGPNAVEVPGECEAREVVDCEGRSLREALWSALMTECETDLYENDIQVELDSGCVTRFSSNRGTSECVVELLRSKRWSCDDESCIVVGSHAL
jgi:hypothetical protein